MKAGDSQIGRCTLLLSTIHYIVVYLYMGRAHGGSQQKGVANMHIARMYVYSSLSTTIRHIDYRVILEQ